MIAKMKKLVIFLPNTVDDIDANLTVLGQLGVMHMMPFQPPEDVSIERVDARIKQLEVAIAILNRFNSSSQLKPKLKDVFGFKNQPRGEIVLMEKVLETESTCLKLEKLKEQQSKELQWYRDWGNISILDIADLNRIGVFFKLYLLDERELKSIPSAQSISITGKLDNLHQVVYVCEDANDGLGFPEVEMPKHQQSDLKDLLKQTHTSLEENLNVLQTLHSQKGLLQEALEERMRRLDIRQIQYAGRNIDDQAICWKGFIPERTVDELVIIAEKNSWGYFISEPDQDELDDVPTLVQSSKWAGRIRPVMNFMGLVSGYKELDTSKVFMIFFTFFSAILVGDAGYGLVFLILTLLVHGKKKFKALIEFDLMYTLSISILIWGVLTGTYFGSQAIAEIPILSLLKIDKLASFGGDPVFIQKLMFTIGAIHLTIGHLQVAWKYNNSVKAIAQLGWVAIIWGLYLAVNQMVLSIPAPGIMLWLFIGGSVLISFFSNPGTSFFKGVLSSLGNLPLSLINGFSDIISYIRLYAVGLSTVLMASSFNEMALGDGISTIASGIGAVLILVLGHGLNMILAGMAVIVHGVRLNMLEYAGHANVEFSGNNYNPFQLKKFKNL